MPPGSWCSCSGTFMFLLSLHLPGLAAWSDCWCRSLPQGGAHTAAEARGCWLEVGVAVVTLYLSSPPPPLPPRPLTPVEDSPCVQSPLAAGLRTAPVLPWTHEAVTSGLLFAQGPGSGKEC